MAEPANSAVEVTPTEFVDLRLQEPQPSRLWKWWVRSTPRAVILKLLGLDSEEAFKSLVAENAASQARVIQGIRNDLDRLAKYTVEQRTKPKDSGKIQLLNGRGR